jgi:hypothetical protein
MSLNNNTSKNDNSILEAGRVGKYMIRPLLALERLTFLEPEGKAGYRHGEKGAE